MISTDLAIIGGGIVGLSTAYQYVRAHPRRSVVVLEKEAELAAHQTGRNSGVLHSGIYYKPGSLKATNCREGKRLMEEFCAAEGVKFEVCGKVIVAVDESEIPALERIEERGIANGVACERIGAERLRELESHAAGIAALHVPGTGIVDYRGACERLAHRIREAGGTILLNAHVTAMHPRSDSVVVRSTASEVEAKRVVNCAGLYSDRVTALSGPRPAEHIIPFRGEYFELKPHAQHLCRNLIYPVPNPAFPFLGVHFTRLATGGVECGPNAVLAFAREGYHNTDVDVRDLIETLAFRGFRRLMSRHWRTGLGELWRSFSKAAFVRALQRLVPAIRAEDLIPAPAGVRAMAIAPDGAMVDDFLIETHERVVNVLNAPSPAATAALNIGKMIVARLH